MSKHDQDMSKTYFVILLSIDSKVYATKDLFHTTGYQYLDMKKAMFKLISLNEGDQFRSICENNQNIRGVLENMLFATFYVLSQRTMMGDKVREIIRIEAGTHTSKLTDDYQDNKK